MAPPPWAWAVALAHPPWAAAVRSGSVPPPLPQGTLGCLEDVWPKHPQPSASRRPRAASKLQALNGRRLWPNGSAVAAQRDRGGGRAQEGGLCARCQSPMRSGSPKRLRPHQAGMCGAERAHSCGVGTPQHHSSTPVGSLQPSASRFFLSIKKRRQKYCTLCQGASRATSTFVRRWWATTSTCPHAPWLGGPQAGPAANKSSPSRSLPTPPPHPGPDGLSRRPGTAARVDASRCGGVWWGWVGGKVSKCQCTLPFR